MMNSATLGASTSGFEVVNISARGLWLFDESSGQEHFLSYTDFPWFTNATVAQISNIQRQGATILHWPDLDVDLDLDCIRHPERYPLRSIR